MTKEHITVAGIQLAQIEGNRKAQIAPTTDFHLQGSISYNFPQEILSGETFSNSTCKISTSYLGTVSISKPTSGYIVMSGLAMLP